MQQYPWQCIVPHVQIQLSQIFLQWFFIAAFPCWGSVHLHCICCMSACCSCSWHWSFAVERTRPESWKCCTDSTWRCQSSHRPRCTHGHTRCTQSCRPRPPPPGQWEWQGTPSCRFDILKRDGCRALLRASVWCHSDLLLDHSLGIQTASNAKTYLLLIVFS